MLLGLAIGLTFGYPAGLQSGRDFTKRTLLRLGIVLLGFRITAALRCSWPTRDGRAGTLRDAILAHGGEADIMRRRFFDLDDAGQQHVMRFLGTL